MKKKKYYSGFDYKKVLAILKEAKKEISNAGKLDICTFEDDEIGRCRVRNNSKSQFFKVIFPCAGRVDISLIVAFFYAPTGDSDLLATFYMSEKECIFTIETTLEFKENKKKPVVLKDSIKNYNGEKVSEWRESLPNFLSFMQLAINEGIVSAAD